MQAFEGLKKRLTEAPVLMLPDQSKPYYYVLSDASKFAIGGVLMQEDDDGELRPVAFASRKLLNAEMNYPTHERELLGILYCLKQWRHILMGTHVSVYTDHKPLKYYHTQPVLGQRFARWLDFISDFDVEFIPIAGVANTAGDALSRRADYLRESCLLQNPVMTPGDNLFPRSNSHTAVLASMRLSLRRILDDTAAAAVESSSPVLTSLHLMNIVDSQYSGDEDSAEPSGMDDNNPAFYDSPNPDSEQDPELGFTPEYSEDYPEPDSDSYPPVSAFTNDVNVFPPVDIQADDDFMIAVKDGYDSDPLAIYILDDTRKSNPVVDRKYHVISGLIYRFDEQGHATMYIPSTGTVPRVSDEVEITVREYVISQCHDTPIFGHLGRDRTVEHVRRSYFWPGLTKDVSDYVKSCKRCQRNKAKSHRPYGLSNPTEVPYSPWECVSIDFITKLPNTTSGYDAILVVVDTFSKRAHFLRCSEKITAAQTAQLFADEIIRLHGLPLKIISDRDVRFTSTFWTELFKKLQTRLAMSTPYHPQTDGQTERMNRVLEEMLRAYCNVNMNDWDQYLAAVEFAYNNSKNSVTGYTPFQVDSGRNPLDPTAVAVERINRRLRVRTPENFLQQWEKTIQEVRIILLRSKGEMKKYMDKTLIPRVYKVGDQVWLDTKWLTLPGFGKNRSLIPKRVGPCEILNVYSNNLVYRLDLPKEIQCHPVQPISRLEPYVEDPRFQHPDLDPDNPTVTAAGDEEFTVDAVTDKRFKKYGTGGRVEYRVQYKGFGPEHFEWLPLRFLTNCMDFVNAYDANLQREAEAAAPRPLL